MLSRKKPSRWSYLRWFLTNNKLILTLALLALYRLLTYVPLPGVDPFQLNQANATLDDSNLVTGLLNLLSGGGFARLSFMTLGIYPFIAANGFMNFLVPILPRFEQRLKEDPLEGRRILSRWQWILVAPASILQAFTLFFAFRSSCTLGLFPRFTFGPEPATVVSILVALTAGAYVATFIAFLIDRFGFKGFGFNAIVFGGAALILTEEVYRVWQGPQAAHWLNLAIYLAGMLAGTLGIAYLVETKRNISVMFPRQSYLRSSTKPAHTSTLPISMRSAWDGLTEAQALLSIPLTISLYLACSSQEALQQAGASAASFLQPGSPWSGPLLFLSVVLFGPFFATLKFSEEGIADQLRRSGAHIPGIHPGEATQKYLNAIFFRVALLAAVLVGFVFLIPWIINVMFGLDTLLLAGEALFLLVVFTHDLRITMQAEYILQGYTTGLI